MLNNIRGLNKVLNKKQKIHLTFIFLSAFLMSVLETIGLGSLVGFIAILSKPTAMIEKMPFDSIKFFLLELDEQTIILYASILIILIFIIKNLIFYIIF